MTPATPTWTLLTEQRPDLPQTLSLPTETADIVKKKENDTIKQKPRPQTQLQEEEMDLTKLNDQQLGKVLQNSDLRNKIRKKIQYIDAQKQKESEQQQFHFNALKDTPLAGRKQIITFLGVNHGVGVSEIAFNSAFLLGQNQKVLYLSLDANGSSMQANYQLGIKNKDLGELFKDNRDQAFAADQILTKVITNSDLYVKHIAKQTYMKKRIQEFPRNLDFMFLKRLDLFNYRPEVLLDDCQILLETLNKYYDVIVVDPENSFTNPLTRVALSYADTIVLITTQYYHDYALSKSFYQTLQANLPDAQLFLGLNKYQKQTLNQLSATYLQDKLLKIPFSFQIPNAPITFNNAAFNAIPIILYTQDEQIQRAFFNLSQKIIIQ